MINGLRGERMYRYLLNSNKTHQIYFTDGVYEKSIIEFENEEWAITMTQLLNDAYKSGLMDGGPLYLKTNYPHIYFDETLKKIRSTRHSVSVDSSSGNEENVIDDTCS